MRASFRARDIEFNSWPRNSEPLFAARVAYSTMPGKSVSAAVMRNTIPSAAEWTQERRMQRKNWLIAAAGAIAAGLFAVPAQSAPSGSAMGAASSASSENPGTEQVHYRYRYYRYHRPHRHYRYYRYRPGIHFYFGRRHHRHHRHHWGW
jgi:hypothetical protein